MSPSDPIKPVIIEAPPAPAPDSFFRRAVAWLGGRKFLVAVLGVLAVVFRERFGISEETTGTLGLIVVGYIAGESGIDIAGILKTLFARKASLILVLALPVLLLSGCGAPPPAVKEGQDLKRAAIQNFAKNQAEIVNGILSAYRVEAFAAIDQLIERDKQEARQKAQALGGKVNVEDALAFAEKLTTIRDEKRAKVDAQIAQIREIMQAAQVDLAIAMKLDEALEQYQAAGVDITIAKNAVGQIMDLVGTKLKPSP